MSKWISIKDNVPGINQKILVAIPEGIATAIFDGKEYCTDHFCELNSWDGVSHWMPLPSSPNENTTTQCEHSGIEWDKDGKVVGVNP